MKKLLLTVFAIFIFQNMNLAQSSNTAWIPENSKIENNGKTRYITPPKGWIYLGTDTKGNLITSKSGGSGTTISCNCVGKGSCLPFSASGPQGSSNGCQGDCDNCSMKQAVTIKDEKIPVISGGYINLSLGIRVAKENETLPSVFKEMFEDSEIKRAFEKFLRAIYKKEKMPEVLVEKNSIKVPEGYSILTFNVYGRGVNVVVPKSYALASGGTSSNAASCSCTDGECSIKTKSIPFVGSASWCEGSCKGTCSLKSKVEKTDSFNRNSITFYRF